ncbi:MAG: nucleoside recognition domain-containing protein [Candidatus Bathyarchaeia archaeon]
MVALYAILLSILLIVGRVLFMVLPGEDLGFVMEMPPYRIPYPKPILMKTYLRIKSFFYIALPLMIIGSIFLVLLKEMGLFDPLAAVAGSFMSEWLGLPPLTVIPLVYGIFRKEMSLEMIVVLFGTTSFSSIFTQHQMLIFSLITALYMPCVATCAALWREFGAKKMLLMTLLTMLVALLVGGLANHAFRLIGL